MVNTKEAIIFKAEEEMQISNKQAGIMWVFD